MHPKKAELLASLDEASRLQDALLRDQLSVALRPDKYGFFGSLGAVVILPLTAFSALMNDVSTVMLVRSDDSVWEKAFPSSGDSR